MILDTHIVWGGAAVFGWGLALFLFFQLKQRQSLLEAMRAKLQEERRLTAGQTARLEGLDDLRATLDEERRRVATLERQEATLLTRIEEREQNLADLRHRLEDEFRTMSSKLVRETGDALLREASQTFQKQQVEVQHQAEGYSRSVSDLLKPMKETLGRYETGLREMRDQQKKAQGELKGQISTLAQSTSAVQAEARSLATALKAGPRTRGRWGETTLRNVVELAGLAPYCDFAEQVAVTDEGASRKQPDMVVRLPGERVVAVDSKVSLTDWLDAAAAQDENAQKKAMEQHGKSVWTHVTSLSAKDYAGALKKDGAIDFVVMFMPGETFFTAAIEARPTLFQDAYERGVLIATPTTLIAILKSIAYSWRQQSMNDHARAVAGMASELYDSLRKTGSYLADLGKSLDKSVSTYNSLVGNMETRVLPRARKFADYEMPGTEKPLALVATSEMDPRTPSTTKDFVFEKSDLPAHPPAPTQVKAS
ncbi:MAG: DNA recombination protein RmuC [Pseudomonadota bacterium]